MIILDDENGNKIQLNDHLVWIDEDQYAPLAQRQEYSITGNLIIETTKKKAGQGITLSAEPLEGVKYRKDALEIKAFFDKTMTTPMRLTLHDGRAFKVVWRSNDVLPIEHPALFKYADPRPDDYVGLTVRFTVI